MPSARTAKRKIFERGRTPGDVQQWSDGRFKCQVVGSPDFRKHELLGEPAVPKFCTSHQLLCLYRQRQFAFCTKRSACDTYSQKNPVLRTLSAWFVNMWKMIQKIKHKKHATGSALLHAPLSFSPDRVSRGKNRRIARHSLCTMHGKSETICHAPQAGVTSEANKK